MSIVYVREQNLPVADYVAVLADTTMRARRPLDNTTRIAEMIAGANFIVTAREDGVILGLAAKKRFAGLSSAFGGARK